MIPVLGIIIIGTISPRNKVLIKHELQVAGW